MLFSQKNPHLARNRNIKPAWLSNAFCINYLLCVYAHLLAVGAYTAENSHLTH